MLTSGFSFFLSMHFSKWCSIVLLGSSAGMFCIKTILPVSITESIGSIYIYMQCLWGWGRLPTKPGNTDPVLIFLNTAVQALTCITLSPLWLHGKIIMCVMDVYMQQVHLFLQKAHKHLHCVQLFLKDRAVPGWQHNLHFAFSRKHFEFQPRSRIITRKIHRISEHIYQLIYKMLFNHL